MGVTLVESDYMADMEPEKATFCSQAGTPVDQNTGDMEPEEAPSEARQELQWINRETSPLTKIQPKIYPVYRNANMEIITKYDRMAK